MLLRCPFQIAFFFAVIRFWQYLLYSVLQLRFTFVALFNCSLNCREVFDLIKEKKLYSALVENLVSLVMLCTEVCSNKCTDSARHEIIMSSNL